MKDFELQQYDLQKIYAKLVSPSKPQTVKACDFFKQPDLINLLQFKMRKTLKQNDNISR